MKRFQLLILLAIASIFVFGGLACGGGDPIGGGGGGGGGPYYTYFWLGANKDCHVTSAMPEFPNPGAFSLVSSHGEPNKEHRFYIQFFMPQLPEGTVVEQAYINLWEDSRTGQPGFQQISIGEAIEDWVPATTTWDEQPNPVGPLGFAASIGAFETEHIWQGTTDISMIVQRHLDDPDLNFGFVFNNNPGASYIRSFMSMNAIQARTQTSMETGPRLLMQVKSDVPLTPENIGTVSAPGSELGTMYGFDEDIYIYAISTDPSGWPGDWDVKIY